MILAGPTLKDGTRAETVSLGPSGRYGDHQQECGRGREISIKHRKCSTIKKTDVAEERRFYLASAASKSASRMISLTTMGSRPAKSANPSLPQVPGRRTTMPGMVCSGS
jgi:hypothetical protein